MVRVTVLLTVFLSFVPIVSADEIPTLTGTGTTVERFIAGWISSDASAVLPGTTEFFGLFADSGSRNVEAEVLTQATFYYNITNFRVSANVAACGGLTGTQVFTFAVRLNGADTSLTGNCTTASAQNSFTLDGDVVAITPGDRLSTRVTLAGGALVTDLRVGMALEGFLTIPVNITTNRLNTMTAFETATSTSGIEFLALFALVIIAIVLWSRSLDLVVKISSGVLCFIAAIVWMLLIINGGNQFTQAFKVACAVVSGAIGSYLIIRSGTDHIAEGHP